MEIKIVDPAAFTIYCKYSNSSVKQTQPTVDDPFTFEVTEFEEGDPSQRWNQLFAYEALQDGDTILSLEEAKKIDKYYKTTFPSLRTIFRSFSCSAPAAADDPKVEDIIKSTPLGFLELFARKLPGKDAGRDFLDTITRYPKLAVLIHPDYPEVYSFFYAIFEELKNDAEVRQMFLEIAGELVSKQQFYEPLKFCLVRNRESFVPILRDAIDNINHEDLQKDPKYQQLLKDPKILLQLADEPNLYVSKDALIQIAKKKIDKKLILGKLNNSTDFSIYSAALEALAIWGDTESIEILENTIKYGSFQAQVMTNFAMRSYLSGDQLAESIESFFEDSDPFVRGAGLKILQFVWHKEGFEPYRDCFYKKVKEIAQFDSNKYVRLAAVECLSYYENKTTPEGYDNTIDFLSDSYPYPIQTKWITDSLRQMAKAGQKPLKVLMTGCSYGTEAFSLLIEIMKDYEANPSAWGNFDPRKDLKIIISDIDTQVLLYAERSYYHFGGIEWDNEFNGMQFYHEVYETDFYQDFERFFEPAPAESADIDQFRLKKPYRDMVEVRYVDVTETPEKPLADMVTFNRLDYIWAGNPNATIHYVHNIFKLSSHYVAYVTWGNPWTPIPLQMFGIPIHQSGPLGFVEKRKLD